MREPTLLERVAAMEAESLERTRKVLKIQEDVAIAKAKSAAEISRLKAALDAERARVAPLVVAFEMILKRAEEIGMPDDAEPDAKRDIDQIRTALKAAKEGRPGPVQPDLQKLLGNLVDAAQGALDSIEGDDLANLPPKVLSKLEAAVSAVSVGEGTAGQPDAATMVKLLTDCRDRISDDSFPTLIRRIDSALSGLSGEGTVPT